MFTVYNMTFLPTVHEKANAEPLSIPRIKHEVTGETVVFQGALGKTPDG